MELERSSVALLQWVSGMFQSRKEKSGSGISTTVGIIKTFEE